MQPYEQVSIAAIEMAEAPVRVTSAKLTAPFVDRLGLPRDFLGATTGILARRFWPRDHRPSEGSVEAARTLLAAVGLSPGDVGAVVSTSVSKDYVEPADACFVHHALGLADTCANFDVSNACLAFLNGMDLVAQMIEAGRIEHGLIVVGESSRPVVEATVARFAHAPPQSDRHPPQIATRPRGAGAAAMLLSHRRHAPEGHAFRGTVTLADTRHHQLCLGTADRGRIDSVGLMEHGVALAQRTWKRATRGLGWTLDSIDLFALHQVSGPHTAELARAVGFDLDRAFPIYPEYGNTGPASIPMVLARAEAENRITPGDRVLLGGIGSGLNCTVGAIDW
ncbi:MAG: 3-oxoacyl-ACP synthase III [Myxococcota bacterium]